MTRNVSQWIDFDEDGRPQLIPERAAVIRKIFEWATAGYGLGSIVKKLDQEKVEPFGDREIDYDEDGEPYFRKVDGKRYGCGQWRIAFLRKLFVDRRVLGEVQPRDTSGKPKGPPIPGYYPPVVTEAEWLAARAAVVGRHNESLNREGRESSFVCLFSGLLKNARDGLAYHMSVCVDKSRPTGYQRRLLNQGYSERKDSCRTFDYETFERAILSQLCELNPQDVLRDSDSPGADVGVLQNEIDWVKQKRAELATVLLKGEVEEIAEELLKLKVRQVQLEEKLEAATDKVVKPFSASLKDVKSLVEILESIQNDPAALEETRLRLRSNIRRIVSKIVLLVVPRGKVRLCQVQIYFADCEARRDCLIIRRQPLRNRHGGQPGSYYAHSLRLEQPEKYQEGDQLSLFDIGDISDPMIRDRRLRELENIPQKEIDKLLAAHGQDIQ